MNNPKISIIIPVYNTAPFLKHCLDSIYNQSFKDFEVLLINDGSTDESGKICDDYCAKDARFKVFHKENGGVSSARNIGLKEMKGEWVFFSDSDDWLESDALQTLLDLASKEDSDLIIAGYRKLDEQGGIKESIGQISQKNMSFEEALQEVYIATEYSYQGYLWNKLFRASIIRQNKMMYDTGIYFNEDRLFIIQFLCYSKKCVAYSTKVVYNYIARSTSAMSSLQTGYNLKYTTDLDAFVKMKHFIFEHCTDTRVRDTALREIVASYITNHEYMIKYNSYDSKVHKYLRKQLIKSGALGTYFRMASKMFVLLLCPKLSSQIKNKRN